MIQDRRRVFKKRGVVLLLCFAAVIFGGFAPAWGDTDTTSNKEGAKYDVFKEINVTQTISDKMKQKMDEAINGAVDDVKITDKGFLLEGVMSNQWIITRAVMNGFGDIGNTISQLESAEFKKAAILDTLIASYKQMNRTEGSGSLGLGSGGYDVNGLRNYINSVDVSKFEGTSAVLEAQKAFTGELRELQKLGFFGGGADSVFSKTRMIAFYLLIISVMARLAFMAYESIVKQQHPPLAWFRVFFKFAILILILIYMNKMILFGISMSDSVRDMITNSSFGNVESAGDVVGRLLRAKVDYLGIDPAISITDLFGKSASMLLAQFLGWLSYFIAAAVLFVIVLLGDIMMALTAVVGPLICALSLMPSFENNFGHWFKGYITLLFYGPLAAVYSVMLVAILTIGLDTSALAFIIISVSYIIGATNVPNMAKNLSGTVLAGLAIGLASMPTKFATGALTQASGSMLRSAARGATGS